MSQACDVPAAIVQEIIISKSYGWALMQPAPAAGRVFFVFDKKELYISDGKKWVKFVCQGDVNITIDGKKTK